MLLVNVSIVVRIQDSHGCESEHQEVPGKTLARTKAVVGAVEQVQHTQDSVALVEPDTNEHAVY